MNRKQFITKTLGVPLVAATANLLTTAATEFSPAGVSDVSNENFWREVRKQFVIDDRFLDLRANSASSIPKASMEKFLRDYRYIQSLPSYRNSEANEEAMGILRKKIAGQINCSEKEVALMRNTTEALNNAIMGLPLDKGDEVVASVHEYDSMMGSFYQRKIRDGITIKTLPLPYRVSDTQEIVNLWERSITPQTKVFLISQIVWISGQIYPVKEICALAKKHGITTIVDAAQSFSHLPIDVKDLDCDYLGTSLHKWCAAPLGTGFLYIRRELIPKTYPLFAHYIHMPDADNIEKFENFGSITPMFGGAVESLDYWNRLGFDLKVQRMQYLKKYWTEKLNGNPKIEIVTDTDAKLSGGLAFFTVKGASASKIGEVLWKKHGIKVPVIENYKNDYVDYGATNVVGIATPVFITLKQLDKFIRAIETIV